MYKPSMITRLFSTTPEGEVQIALDQIGAANMIMIIDWETGQATSYTPDEWKKMGHLIDKWKSGKKSLDAHIKIFTVENWEMKITSRIYEFR